MIQAHQFLTLSDANFVIEWSDGLAKYDPIEKVLLIPTLEGTMTASHGDWVIKGVEGEFYPCKPSVFSATYEVTTS